MFLRLLIALSFTCLSLAHIHAQEVEFVDSAEVAKQNQYIIITQSGGEFIGKIIRQDEREVLIETVKMGKVAIPKYEIKEMKQLEQGELTKEGKYKPDQIFATRYFVTANGLPIKKGEHYVKFSLLGPDINFALAENLSLGLITSWFGTPMLVSTKYSVQLSDKSFLGAGVLLGTLGWTQFIVEPGFVGGALPFLSYTIGSRKSNFSVSAGYGQVWFDGESGGGALGSVAGMVPITARTSFVVESMMTIPVGDLSGLYAGYLTPGMRFNNKRDGAFQFGLSAVFADGELVPFPLPSLAWYQKF